MGMKEPATVMRSTSNASKTRPLRFSGKWETRLFEQVLVRLNAKANQIQKCDYHVEGQYPVIDQGEKYIVGFSDEGDLRLQCPDGGVIVFGDHTCIVKYVSFDFLVGADGTQILRALPGQCTRYYAYQLQYKGIASTGYNRHFKFLKERKFLVPLFPEQRAISEALSDVDGLLGALEALIAKKQAIKKATMQQLLTGKTRLPSFSGEWKTRSVSDFGEIVTGATPRTQIIAFWDGLYPWITPSDISFHRDMITSARMITKEGLDSIRPLPSNTVLVTCIASIGKNAILKTKGGCNQQINAVIPNAAHSAEFLYYLFEHNTQYLLSKAGITATNIVSKTIFSRLSFKIPFFDEQTAIAEVLSDMDSEITVLDRRRDKTRAIKQGMMQQLLTGKTRLVKAGAES